MKFIFLSKFLFNLFNKIYSCRILEIPNCTHHVLERFTLQLDISF